MNYTDTTLIKKGDSVVITKNVYYIEDNREKVGLTTEKPEVIVWLDEGTIMTAQTSGVFEEVIWYGDGRDTGLKIEWVS